MDGVSVTVALIREFSYPKNGQAMKRQGLLAEICGWVRSWVQEMKNTLTVATIRGLEPKPRRFTVRDGRGLELEVWPSGVMSWRVRYFLHGKNGRSNVGRYPGMSLSQARAKRDELAAAIRSGLSPADVRRRECLEAMRRVTVREFGERYLREVVENTRKEPRTIRRYLERDVYPALGSMPLSAVEKHHVREIVFKKRDCGHGMAAVAVRNVLKRLFDYAVELEACAVNPAAAIAIKFIAQAQSRDRALNEAEIGLFLRRLDAARMRSRLKAALRLILLTLTRKSEMRLMRWEHVNLDRGEWEIPPENMKGGKGQIVYLSKQAKDLLAGLKAGFERSGFVFYAVGSSTQPISPSTLNRALNRLDHGMTHFTVHDLRRTSATRLSEMGFDRDVIEKALSHKIAGVRGVYNRAEYADQRRTMLQAWADCLDILAGIRADPELEAKT
jgi:integrase